MPADFAQDRIVQIDKDEIRIDILHERVRQAMLERTTSRCSSAPTAPASVQDIVDVIDKLKDAGVEKVGLMTKPLER